MFLNKRRPREGRKYLAPWPLNDALHGVCRLTCHCPECCSDVSQSGFVGEVMMEHDRKAVHGRVKCDVCGHTTMLDLVTGRDGTRFHVNGHLVYSDLGTGLTGFLRTIPKYVQLLWLRLINPTQPFSFRVNTPIPERVAAQRQPSAFSDSIIGVYLGREIPEWAEFDNDGRYFFDGIVRNFREGLLAAKDDEAIIWPGLLYRRSASVDGPWETWETWESYEEQP